MSHTAPKRGTLFLYEIRKGVFLKVQRTGKVDTTCPRASFSRREFKVLDYGLSIATFPNDLIYDMPSDYDKFECID